MQSATYYLKMFGEPAEKPENPLACALRELSETDPRLAEAVGLMFATVDYLGDADPTSADPQALRRVGYLLERFGNASPSTLKELHAHVVDVETPVFFTSFVSPSRVERLVRQSNELQRKWGVYCDLDLRTRT